MTVTNKGPNAATDNRLQFLASGDGNLVSATGPAGWTCSKPSLKSAFCTNPSLAAGASATFSFPMTAVLFTTGKVTQSVTVFSPNELNYADNVASATTLVSPDTLPDFNLTIGAPAVVHPGSTVTYTITVTNTTVNTASNPVLQFTTTPLSPVTWTCPDSPVPGVCGLGTMVGGSTRTILASVPVVADADSKMTGIASIVGGPFLHNPRATVTSTVEATAADLSVALTATPSTLTVGDTVTFTILTTNIGGTPAGNVTVHLPLSPSLALVSSTGHCTGDSDVQCAIGSLAPAAWSTISITARAVVPGTGNVTATAQMDGSEAQISNNSATAPVTVTPAPAPARRRAARH